MDNTHIFSIANEEEFFTQALRTFQYQYKKNKVYQTYCTLLGIHPDDVDSLKKIPFLPIQFFRDKTVVTGDAKAQITFTSSGTTGQNTSKHFVTDISLYETSYTVCFETFYGPISEGCILALLPSYLERQGSSLVYMVNDLIQKSGHPKSGFFLDDFETLKTTLLELKESNTKTILIGVSFALLDFASKYRLQLPHAIVMETGGMKGRRKEMVREELHSALKKGFGVAHIHSEYGMTELLSQAYSYGNGQFETPPWMKVLVRDTEDPFSYLENGRTGGVSIIDLANWNSCSFIATQDLGKLSKNGQFEILGRFDHSDIRGCNLMAL